MNLPDQEHWFRVQQRLRAEVGEEIFKSWFAAMEHDAVEGDTVRLSVPTRFLKSWVQSHYADKLLACWKAAVSAASVDESMPVKPSVNAMMSSGKHGKGRV